MRVIKFHTHLNDTYNCLCAKKIPVLLHVKNDISVTCPTRQSMGKIMCSYDWNSSMEYTTLKRSRYKWRDNIKMYYEGTGSVVVHWVQKSQNRAKSQDFVIKIMDLLLHRGRILTSWGTISLKEKHYHWISYVGCFVRHCYEDIQWEMPLSSHVFLTECIDHEFSLSIQ